MYNKYIPDQGDIVRVNLDTDSLGHEIYKERPCLVISSKMLNKLAKFCIIVPITTTKHDDRVSLKITSKTVKGEVLMLQLRSIDFEKRQVSFIEKADLDTVKKACAIASTIVSFNC